MTAQSPALGFAEGAQKALPEGGSTLTLVIENMHCGGCLRSVERAALKVPGAETARATLSARRVSVVYDQALASAADFISALKDAGFTAAPIEAAKAASDDARQKYLLRCMAVAGFAAMNIMLISVAVWSGEASDMDPALAIAFRWISALIALPTVAYAGQPFFTSALGALRGRRLNMDVPISLAIILATFMSVYQTMRGSEQFILTPPYRCCFCCSGPLFDETLRVRTPWRSAESARSPERNRHDHRF
jgi:Cu2+-exporting ATPase